MKACPDEWRRQRLEHTIIKGFAICGSIAGALGVLQFVVNRVSLVTFVAQLSQTSAFFLGIAALKFRVRVTLELVEVAVWGTCAAGAAIGALAAEELVYRNRSQVYGLLLSFMLPLFFGMGTKVYMMYAFWVVSVNIAATMHFASIRGDQVAFAVYVSTAAYGVGFCAFSYLQTMFFKNLYEAEQATAKKNQAAESLISMFCDASVWLADDLAMVVSCDHRFNSLMGSDMAGSAFADCLEPDDRSRLTESLGEAELMLLPATLRLQNGTRKVNLYIVGMQTSRSTSCKSQLAILMGICYTEEQTFENSQILAPILEVAGEPKTPRDREATGSQVSAMSLPTTTPTLGIFKLLNPICSDTLVDTLEAVEKLGRQEHWLIEQRDVKLIPGNVLGKGGFGTVVGASYFGSPVALKITREDWGSDNAKQLPELCNELLILRRVQHPNLVQLHGAIIDPHRCLLGMVMELVEGGDLSSFLRAEGRTPLKAQYEVTLGVCSALWYLHTRRPIVVHGDLKPGNVLVSGHAENGTLQVKLADFGLSRLIMRSTRPMGGTIRWMAPEVFQRMGKPRPSADVFSFGRLLFYVATKKLPYADLQRDDLISHLRSGSFPPLSWQNVSLLEGHCKELVSDCLQQASQRPAMEEIHQVVTKWRVEFGSVDQEGPGAECGWQEGLLQLHTGPPLPSDQKIHTGAARYEFPMLNPTSEEAKMLTILQALMQWNFRVFETSCCSFHAALADVHLMCSRLEGQTCRAIPHLDTKQCQQCGLLVDSVCEVCNPKDQTVSMEDLSTTNSLHARKVSMELMC